MWEAFALQNLLSFFQQKISVYLVIKSKTLNELTSEGVHWANDALNNRAQDINLNCILWYEDTLRYQYNTFSHSLQVQILVNSSEWNYMYLFS